MDNTNNKAMVNKMSGLPRGPMKKNNKFLAIQRLFIERDEINNDFLQYKYKNEQVIQDLHNEIYKLKQKIKYLNSNKNENLIETINELLSLKSYETNNCNCTDKECEHKVNFLTYLNTPD